MPKDDTTHTTTAPVKTLPPCYSNLELLMWRWRDLAEAGTTSPIRALARVATTYNRAEYRAAEGKDGSHVAEDLGNATMSAANRITAMPSRDTLDMAAKLALAMLLDPHGEESQGLGAELIAAALADAVLLADGPLPDVSEVASMTDADTRLQPRRREELP